METPSLALHDPCTPGTRINSPRSLPPFEPVSLHSSQVPLPIHSGTHPSPSSVSMGTEKPFLTLLSLPFRKYSAPSRDGNRGPCKDSGLSTLPTSSSFPQKFLEPLHPRVGVSVRLRLVGLRSYGRGPLTSVSSRSGVPTGGPSDRDRSVCLRKRI